MERRELLGLLEATSSAANERTTARMPVITKDSGHDSAAAAGVSIGYTTPAGEDVQSHVRAMVVSFVLSLTAGFTLAAVLM